MSGLPHLLVRASAGTGKTYQLTSRYLALLFGGADPHTVLATTFTRKAAHEILDRVIDRLAGGAREQGELAKIEAAIGRKSSPEECTEVLERLLRGMDKIRIGTIDSFFAQLARSCALDLGLAPGWRIADEAESELLRSEAVVDSVAKAEKLELLELLRDLQRQSVGPSVHEELLRFVREGREALLESKAEAWERIRPLPDVKPEELAAALAALPGLALPRTKSGKNAGGERIRWSTDRARLVELTGRGDWDEVIKAGLAQKVCAGEATFDKVPIEAAHLAVLRPIVAHALHEATKELALQNRAARTLLEKHEASYGALSRARGLLRFEDLPNALAPIAGGDPLTARGVDLPHRLDGRIDHLLLDEFQDTAPVQWRVLKSIAEPILRDESGRRSFFCVGDVKQSIYGWRTAEPRLLGEFTRKRPTIRTEELHESHRSSAPVLETVNQVFEGIAKNPAFVDSDGKERVEAQAAAAEFQKGFVHHVPAKRAGGELPGAVFVVRAAAADDRGGRESAALTAAVERVRGILEEAPAATIGILTRRRKWIPELIHRLRKHGIHASDEGGNPLTDSVAVLHALSLLHLADHPGDSAAAFHVATSPLGRKVGLTVEELERGIDESRGTAEGGEIAGQRGIAEGREIAGGRGIAERRVMAEEQNTTGSKSGGEESSAMRLADRSRASRSAVAAEGERASEAVEAGSAKAAAGQTRSVWQECVSEVSQVVRRALAERGFGGYLASIRPADGEGYGAWDAGRFGQLVDLALAWEGRAGSRASAFVEHVRKTKVEDPSAAQVRVMTVHGAKGLEFDAVILPELDGALARREERLLTWRPEPEGAIEVVTHGARKEVSKAHAELERVRVEVAKGRMVEELCVLYVAMTRAIHSLDLIMQARESEGGGLTYAAILRGALRVDAAGADGLAWKHEKTAGRWFRTGLAGPEELSAEEKLRITRSAGIPSKEGTETLESDGEVVRGTATSQHKRLGGKGEPVESKASAAGRLQLGPSVVTRSLERFAPSRSKIMGLNLARDMIRPHDVTTVRGRIIHRLLAEVKWIETFDRSDEELMAIGRTIEPDDDVVASVLGEFRAALARPATKRLLSRPSGDAKVWRERRFSVVIPEPSGSLTLCTGAFDRVVVRRGEGRVTSAEIIDYKADQFDAATLCKRATLYGPQMNAYKRALGWITGLAQREIQTTLLFLAADLVMTDQECSDST